MKTAPNRTVGYSTAPNRPVVFTISENRTEPDRKIPDFLKPHRTGRRIFDFRKPHRVRTDNRKARGDFRYDTQH